MKKIGRFVSEISIYIYIRGVHPKNFWILNSRYAYLITNIFRNTTAIVDFRNLVGKYWSWNKFPLLCTGYLQFREFFPWKQPIFAGRKTREITKIPTYLINLYKKWPRSHICRHKSNILTIDLKSWGNYL